MIEKSTLTFLRDLSKNNNKEWFDGNRKRYEGERKRFIDFVQEVIDTIGRFDPSVADNQAAKSVFRINRDIRFSKDKTPYKTNFAASIKKGGKHTPYVGYYLHLQPGEIFAGGGLYAPDPAILKAVRDEIYFCLPEFEKILGNKALVKEFGGLEEIEKLKSAPKGYEKDHPSIPYLQHKHFIISRSFTDAEATAPDFLKKLESLFKAQQPFTDFINRAIDNQSNS